MLELAVDDVQIRPAHAAGVHVDADLVSPGFWIGQFDPNQRGVQLP